MSGIERLLWYDAPTHSWTPGFPGFNLHQHVQLRLTRVTPVASDAVLVREDADDVRAALHFLVEPLKGVRAVQLDSVLLGAIN
jgi:hypothetical protein